MAPDATVELDVYDCDVCRARCYVPKAYCWMTPRCTRCKRDFTPNVLQRAALAGAGESSAAARDAVDAARWRFVAPLAWFVDAVAKNVLERCVWRDGAIDADEAQDAIDDIMTAPPEAT